jgi:uncharacterized protein DUF2844
VPPICSRTARSTAAGRGWVAKTGAVPALVFAQLLASVFPAPSWAALGDTEAAVTLDSQTLYASPRVATRAAFTVHELQTPTGTVIREFVAPSGVVFAVSWRGPFKPSMSLLLGQYFAEYAHAPRSPGSTRSRLIVEQPNLIVHAGGHMRSFAGIAYTPGRLPANVVEADLQ